MKCFSPIMLFLIYSQAVKDKAPNLFSLRMSWNLISFPLFLSLQYSFIRRVKGETVFIRHSNLMLEVGKQTVHVWKMHAGDY